jgi:PIN domain nuclease of toxin-antitoxin system
VTVVDTHAWIWWVSQPSRLGKGARHALEQASRVGVPAISCLEFAALAARGRITLDRPPLDWILDALALPRFELLPLTPAVAVKAAGLPADFPGDPADRLIVATALIEAAPLVTKDDRVRRSGVAETVWS